MTSPAQKNAPFRWNQEPHLAGRELPHGPYSCSEITKVVMGAIEADPHKDILGFEGQLTTFPCISQFQEMAASKGYRTVVCFTSRDAVEKMTSNYSNPNLWHDAQHQVFVIKNRNHQSF
jgi:hypothetical protein